jgi:hypothetical protein
MKIKRFEQLNEAIDPKDPKYRKAKYIELIKDVLKMYVDEIEEWNDGSSYYLAELYDLTKDLLESAQMFGSREEQVEELVRRLEEINVPY